MKALFIRELTKSEKANPTRHMSKLPDKAGYSKVYMPYGKDGRGYYYKQGDEVKQDTFVCPWCSRELPIKLQCGKGYCRRCSGSDF